MSLSNNSVGSRSAVLTAIEVQAFKHRLKDVLVIEGLVEDLKLYGKERTEDIGSHGTKKTKGNTTPDLIDFDLIDSEQKLKWILLETCRLYEENVLISRFDEAGVLVQEPLAPLKSASFASMVEYLSNDAALGWMQFQQDFDDDVELVLVAISKLERRVKQQDKKPVKKKVEVNLVEKLEGSPENVPMTPVALKKMLAAKYPITTKDIRNWATRGKIERHKMSGARDGYLPSEVVKVYNEMVTKSKKVA